MTVTPRRKRKRPRRMAMVFATTCETGKRGYPGRSYAEAAARLHRTQGDHVRPYRCESCTWWHIGHLPRATRRGEMSDVEFYDRKRARKETVGRG